MAWHFRKRRKVIPEIHLNFSSSGISTSIGVKGSSVTFSKSGAYLTTSNPKLGIYNKHKLSGPNPPPQVISQDQPKEPLIPINSADINEISSQNMQEIKEAIILAQEKRIELMADLSKIKLSLVISKLKYGMSYLFLYKFIKKGKVKDLETDIKTQKEAIIQTEEHIDNCFVKLNIKFEQGIKLKYQNLTEAFKNLITCKEIWAISSTHFKDKIGARPSPNTIVNKRNVKFAFKSLPDIKSDFNALYFQNANCTDLYFYPSFVVMYPTNKDFTIVGLDEIQLNQSHVYFTVTGNIPKDSKIIDRTWAKFNKNETLAQGFKGNYQIPALKYGEINLTTNTGLNEGYQFSNYEFTEEFSNAFRDYQSTINRLKCL